MIIIKENTVEDQLGKTFSAGWAFAEKHMPAVRLEIASLPAGMFFDIATAEAKQDLQEATDLILELLGGTMAVRVRSKHFWKRSFKDEYHPDWSVRFRNSIGTKTEIHKLQTGFASWYFYGYSADDEGDLAAWWVLDLDAIRSAGILEGDTKEDFESNGWQIHPNRSDKSSGMYFPIRKLIDAQCVLYSSVDLQ